MAKFIKEYEFQCIFSKAIYMLVDLLLVMLTLTAIICFACIIITALIEFL